MDDEIERCITNGWEDVVQFFYNSGFHFWEKYKPEYLITSCITLRLNSLNSQPRERIIIELEKPTTKTFEECFEAVKFDKGGRSAKFRGKINKPNRSGRVDIVLSQPTDNLMSPLSTKYVIEVKGFDPPYQELEKEVIRITELLNLHDDIGDSSLSAGYITYGLDHSKLYHPGYNQKKKNHDLEKKAYSVVDKLKARYPVTITHRVMDLLSLPDGDDNSIYESTLFRQMTLKLTKKST
jgi:hypothetical protein